jgi:hypothetical protein
MLMSTDGHRRRHGRRHQRLPDPAAQALDEQLQRLWSAADSQLSYDADLRKPNATVPIAYNSFESRNVCRLQMELITEIYRRFKRCLDPREPVLNNNSYNSSNVNNTNPTSPTDPYGANRFQELMFGQLTPFFET